MVLRIERDASRFRQIVRGAIKSNLRKYVTHGELLGRRGKDIVSIPIPQLDLPRFRHGRNQGGVGRGDGEIGDPLGRPDDQKGGNEAGSEPGLHLLEVEVTLQELADILAEELQLPRIEPKGTERIIEDRPRYNSIRRVGPESLRHFKRTYIQALRRQISSGSYQPGSPAIIPRKEDRRYRSYTNEEHPRANAAVIYVMDVSGSMSDEQKELVRTEAFWIDTWLSRQYDGVETSYVIHDASAREVDSETFFRVRENGGTRISSAYEVCKELIENRYPPSQWNIYIFQFSDGDNWGDDNTQAIKLLEEQIVPHCNLFCYGQVESIYGSGQFLHFLRQSFGDQTPNLITSQIPNREAILDSIKEFLGKGR